MSSVIYEPKIGKVSLVECLKTDKFDLMCNKIDLDPNLSEYDKKLLKLLATRFIIFKYEKLADYYASTTSNMKNWLEQLNCVIIDDNKAIERGYFKYLDEYNKFLGDVVNEK